MSSISFEVCPDERIQEWGELCGEVFAKPGADPKRFRLKFDSDPLASADDIHVRTNPYLS